MLGEGGVAYQSVVPVVYYLYFYFIHIFPDMVGDVDGIWRCPYTAGEDAVDAHFSHVTDAAEIKHHVFSLWRCGELYFGGVGHSAREMSDERIVVFGERSGSCIIECQCLAKG